MQIFSSKLELRAAQQPASRSYLVCAQRHIQVGGKGALPPLKNIWANTLPTIRKKRRRRSVNRWKHRGKRDEDGGGWDTEDGNRIKRVKLA